MPITEVEIFRSCISQNSPAARAISIMSTIEEESQSPCKSVCGSEHPQSPSKTDGAYLTKGDGVVNSQKKLALKVFYKIWSAFTKMIKNHSKDKVKSVNLGYCGILIAKRDDSNSASTVNNGVSLSFVPYKDFLE
jgi:hypothetical protein